MLLCLWLRNQFQKRFAGFGNWGDTCVTTGPVPGKGIAHRIGSDDEGFALTVKLVLDDVEIGIHKAPITFIKNESLHQEKFNSHDCRVQCEWIVMSVTSLKLIVKRFTLKKKDARQHFSATRLFSIESKYSTSIERSHSDDFRA